MNASHQETQEVNEARHCGRCVRFAAGTWVATVSITSVLEGGTTGRAVARCLIVYVKHQPIMVGTYPNVILSEFRSSSFIHGFSKIPHRKRKNHPYRLSRGRG